MRLRADRHASRHARGVTLFETLIACVVMGAGLLALLQAHLQLHGQAETARLRAQALQLAQRELEGLRAGTRPLQDAASAEGPFTLQRRVSAREDGLQAVRLDVAWNDRAGQAQALSLHGLVASLDATFSGALGVVEPSLTLRRPSVPIPTATASAPR
ncbi:type IV pilus modification PilV family protein [Azohydromonas caseinilytica]|uniref:Type IV pilus assembly protein PilV n=1 Tax=Azohydromonas caseinilytica TaxID=2728836 RepID=A0A848F6D1_9BURK|nr:hypothetical protein [Azohydromonas caseinilytica]NML14718.1 hypothetical protein [Azohydromonas caseinilytica]